MALSIVAQADALPEAFPGITRSARWYCDVYNGTADALVAAGVITREQLEPQKGRPAGLTTFLPSGQPCPVNVRSWREPGYKAIRQQEDGSLTVEVTVAKDVQLWRRRAERAAKQHARQEEERERINKEIAESGHKYRNWQLRQDFDRGAETWEGTKAQLQAAGLGVGLAFPGEPGAPEHLDTKCPLGFDFRIHLPYDRAKAAAGIYTASSWYVQRAEEAKQYVPHAPGVVQEVWTPDGWLSWDVYQGTAAALIQAGLVPALSFFPGQPGRNKVQASYRKDWRAANSSSVRDRGVTIRKRGKSGQFCVEVYVSADEEERRRAARHAREEEAMKRAEVLAKERKELRQAADRDNKSTEQFRSERASLAELTLRVLWSTVFKEPDGALSFHLPDGDELRDDLAEAFQTIRDAVQQADILRDKKVERAAQTKLKLAAVRNDKGLQSLLHSAQHLRLVHSAPDNVQG